MILFGITLERRHVGDVAEPVECFRECRKQFVEALPSMDWKQLVLELLPKQFNPIELGTVGWQMIYQQTLFSPSIQSGLKRCTRVARRVVQDNHRGALDRLAIVV